MRVLAFCVLFSAAVSAQTVEMTIDLSAFNWGMITKPKLVETDGDLSTREWLVRRPFATEVRIVAERNGGICAGPWFSPLDQPLDADDVQRDGLIHKIVAQRLDGQIVVVTLETPVCR